MMTIGIFSFIYNPKTVLSCLVFFFFSSQFSFKREAKSLNLPSHPSPQLWSQYFYHIWMDCYFFSFFFIQRSLPLDIEKTKRSNDQGYKDFLINQVRGTIDRVSSIRAKSGSDHKRLQLLKDNLDNRKIHLRCMNRYLKKERTCNLSYKITFTNQILIFTIRATAKSNNKIQPEKKKKTQLQMAG